MNPTEYAIVKKAIADMDRLLPQIRALTEVARASQRMLVLQSARDTEAMKLADESNDDILEHLDEYEREIAECETDLFSALSQLPTTPPTEDNPDGTDCIDRPDA
jgi:hypothetical protein